MSEISLSDAFLDQSPACHWIVDRSGVFQRIYGDPAPVFARSSAKLLGQSYTQALDPEIARNVEGTHTGARSKAKWCAWANDTAISIWNISVFPVRGTGSAIRYAGALAREITAWTGRAGTAGHGTGGAQGAGVRAQYGLQVPARLVGQNLTALGLQLDLCAWIWSGRAGNLRAYRRHAELLEEMMEASASTVTS